LILALLKSSTTADHRRVEAAMPSLAELARPEGYAWSLRAMHRFFLTWEAPLFEALAHADDRLTLAERGKLSLLSADLESLRLPPLRAPCAPPGDVTASVATALGAMYVLEGSTLGGRVIERHCAGPLGVSPAHGGAFYHGYGARTGSLWQTCGAVLESQDTDARARTAMLHGARACFGALRGFLESVPAPHRTRQAGRRHG
jgi:heme oxygenase